MNHNQLLDAAFVKLFFVNQLLTVIAGMKIWCIVRSGEIIKDKIELHLKENN